MFPVSFDYEKPASIEDAARQLVADPENKLLAGGQSLIPSLKLRLASPPKLIDISHIASLKGIAEMHDQLVIGANATHSEIEHSATVKKHAGCLAQSAGLIGDMMIRNRGTIGGSLAHADPAADYPGVLVALGGSIKTIGATGGRTISLDNFFTGFFETALNPGEIIQKITIPSYSGWKSCYLKFPNPASRYPIVGCAVLLKTGNGICQDIRVGFSGVGYAAFRDQSVEKALKGVALTPESIKEAADKAAEGIEILEDSSANAEYRKHMAKYYAACAIRSLVQ